MFSQFVMSFVMPCMVWLNGGGRKQCAKSANHPPSATLLHFFSMTPVHLADEWKRE